MKKFCRIFSLSLALAAAFALSACNESQHVHIFSSDWSFDETYHWHAPTCTDTTEKRGLAEHRFSNGVCSVCGAPDPNANPQEGGGGTSDEGGGTSDEGGGGQGGTPDEGGGGQGGTPDEKYPDEEAQTEEPLFGGEALFEGNFTPLADGEEKNRAKEFLLGQLLLARAGTGFHAGDLFLQTVFDQKITETAYISGADSDLFRGENVKIKIVTPLNASYSQTRYASQSAAYEISYRRYVYALKGAAEIVVQNQIGAFCDAFGKLAELLDAGAAIEYQESETFMTLRAVFTETSETPLLAVSKRTTFSFAFFEGKIVGLKAEEKNSIDKNLTETEYFSKDSSSILLVGNYPFALPGDSSCEPLHDRPDWTNPLSAEAPALDLAARKKFSK